MPVAWRRCTPADVEFMNPEELSARYQPQLGEELRSQVGTSLLPMYNMMRYHLGWIDADGQVRLTSGGKLLRPGLCLLSCEAVGGDWRGALPAAAALELLHNFTLIHDDIEDVDVERRGIPTVWHVWGQAQGINTGDAMHVLARLALLKLEDEHFSSGAILRAVRTLDEACLRLCEGQYLDISFEERVDIGVEDYLEMIGGKTAALFACSLKLGALLGTEDEPTIEHLVGFGHNLGMAFQVRDDVLGIWGEDSVTGKSTAGDIIKRKKTLPVIYALREAGPEDREALLSIYRQSEILDADIPRVRGVLDRVGACRYAGEIVRQYSDTALAELAKAEIAPSLKEEFISLSQAMIGREY